MNNIKTNKVVYYYADPVCECKCGFCYARDNSRYQTLWLSEIKSLIKISKSYGFNHFWLTWWNPFKRKDIGDILEILKNEDFYTRVDTNWLGNTFESIKKYSKYIDRLWLPLDWHIASIHDFNRSFAWHYNVILDLIKNLKIEKLDINLKVNTVLTIRNFASVVLMRDLIKQISPNIRSIYKYFPAWIWYKNRKEFDIPWFLFHFAIQNIPHHINKTIVDIQWDETHDKSFLLISSNWELYGCFDSEKSEYKSFWYYNAGWFDKALKYYNTYKISNLTKREFSL